MVSALPADLTLLPARSLAKHSGGQVSLYRGGNRAAEVLHPQSEAIQALQQRLKASFDPAGVFNPGRAYSWL